MSQGKVPTGRQPTGPRRSAPWTGAATSSRSRPPWCPVPREVLPAKGVSWPLGGGRPLRSRTEYTVPQCVRLLASPRHPGQGDGTDARPDDVGAEERGGGTNWHGASLQGRATPLCLLDQHHDVVGRDVDDSEVRGPGFSEDRNSGTAPVTQLPASNRVRPVQTASAYLGLSRRGTRKRNSRHQDPGAELSSTFHVVTSLGRVDSRQEVFANGLAAEASGLPSRFHQPYPHRLFITVAAADIRGRNHVRKILFLRF